MWCHVSWRMEGARAVFEQASKDAIYVGRGEALIASRRDLGVMALEEDKVQMDVKIVAVQLDVYRLH